MTAVHTISCAVGTYVVRAGACPLLGDLEAEVMRAATAHAERCGTPPDAIRWDDAVLLWRAEDAALSLVRSRPDWSDRWLAAALDPDGAVATRVGAAAAGGSVAQAPGLARLVGWPGRSPERDVPAPRPARQAKSILIVVPDIVDAAAAIGCLHGLAGQNLTASCEILLDDAAAPVEAREAIDIAVSRLFAPGSSITVTRPADGIDQADAAAAAEVVIRLETRCRPLDGDTIQSLADWTLEPGVGAAVPRLLGPDGAERISAYPAHLLHARDDAPEPCRAWSSGRGDGPTLHAGPVRMLDTQPALAEEPAALEAGLACDDPDASGMLAVVALYRRAWRHWRDPDQAHSQAVDDAFRDLVAERLPPGVSAAAQRLHEERLTARIKAACAAFAASGALDKQADSLTLLRTMQSFSPRRTEPAAAPPPQPDAVEADEDPDPAGRFRRHADRPDSAVHRLLVFADAFGPSQQLMFLHGLGTARRDGRVAVQLLDEADVQALVAAGRSGEAMLSRLLRWWRPTAIVFSRYADAAGLAWLEARLGPRRVPRLLHLDDDLFGLPAQVDVERYRAARHPARIHALARLGATSDLVLATSPVLAARLEAQFGRPAAWCDPGMIGEPARAAVADPTRAIGYFGSASHDPDLATIAPALRAAKATRPDLRIEIVGSVARRPAARGLADVAMLRTDIVADYRAFRTAMRGWGWDIGLAPLVATPFNAAKTPVKWAEYTQAGIPVLASATPPYLDIAARGALLAVPPDGWAGALERLIRAPALRVELVHAARALLGLRSRRETEARILGLLDRARHNAHRLARLTA